MELMHGPIEPASLLPDDASDDVGLEPIPPSGDDTDADITPATLSLKKPLLCRWGFHGSIAIDPTDDEFDELCKLLGRSRSSLADGNIKSLRDSVCYKCGELNPILQRFLASLRKLRGQK